MFVSHVVLHDGRHSTSLCKQGTALEERRSVEEDPRKAREVVFTIRWVQLDNVREFVYIGHNLLLMDEDAPYVHNNVVKALQMWTQASRILLHEKPTPSTTVMFYKSVAQTVLLFGSETWVVTPRMMNTLESFHRQVSCRIAGRSPVYLRREEQWSYPFCGDAYEKTGMHTGEECITHRRNIIVDYVASHHSFTLCCEANYKGWGVQHQKWWEQLS
jgi:hypothetical protein